ncbi:ATP-binding protein [Streptomyces asiaticus]
MDPKNRGSQEHGHDETAPGTASGASRAADGPGDGSSPRPPAPPRPTGDVPTPPLGAPVPGASASPPSSASSASSAPASASPARTARIVAGDHLLTVNPVDGSEIEPCPPGERPARPERRGPDERAELRRAAAAPRPSGTVVPELPVLERDEERERLARLLARGRSVRVTGPSGAGRSSLLEAVASDCERLAPDGVVRLSGYHRTPTDLLHDLYAAVLSAPLYRPDRAELLAAVQEIGAVVVLDDIEFGGAALDEFLDATPECAFLISATPDVPAPSPDSHLEEVFLSGLSRTAGLELLERAARRPLDEDEASWAADLWFESEGLPLRFVQAGALLRQRDAQRDDASAPEAEVPLPSIAEAASPAALLAARLGEAARDALRFAVALGGECPHQVHLRALAADTHADAALGELLGCGLVTPAGSHYRLAARVTAQLAEAGYADEDAGRAHTVAQHYAWWAAHPSVAPERVAAEADAILAAMTALIGSREAGHADAAVLLARAAAPALAAALQWGAWERAVRHGQEAARLAGQVADEAYFHHELGVLALCTGHLDRARAELEASIGLRGVLADKRGTVAGRRALALVADRSPGSAMAGAFGTSGGNRKDDAVPPATGGAPDDTETTIVTPKVATTTPMAAMGGTAATAATTAVTAVVPSASRTSVAAPATPTALTAASAPAGPSGGKPGGLRRLATHGARRNVVAAAAGVLLVAVLGTVVTLGTMGGDSDSPADKVKPDRSASQRDDDKGLTADEPTSGTSQAPQPGLSGVPKASTSPTAPSGSGSPGGSTATSGPSSTSGSPSDTERPPSSPSSHPTTSDPRPTTKPPTGRPTTPTGEPTKPTPTTSSPTTTPTGDTSTTASAPTTHTASSTATPVA